MVVVVVVVVLKNAKKCVTRPIQSSRNTVNRLIGRSRLYARVCRGVVLVDTSVCRMCVVKDEHVKTNNTMTQGCWSVVVVVGGM